MTEPATTLKCRACASPLHPAASLCAVCKTHTSGWKNTLPHIGAAVAVITLAVSGFTFVIGKLSDQHTRATAAPSIVLGDLSSPNGNIVLLNVGNQDALVKAITLECEALDWFTVVPVYKLLPAGQTLAIPLSGTPGLLVNFESQERWERLLKSAPERVRNLELLPAVFSPESPTLKAMKSRATTLRALLGTARIDYLASNSSTAQAARVEDLVVLIFYPEKAKSEMPAVQQAPGK